MPEVKIILTPGELEKQKISNRTVVVIDALRASTTIVTALSNGIDSIIPFSSKKELLKYYNKHKEKNNLLLAGEDKGRKIAGFDLDNSPLSFLNPILKGKTILFKTSNGTSVLNKIDRSNLILVGSLINSKIISELIMEKGENVYLICAGSNGAFSLEDFVSAGRFCYLLKQSAWKGDDLTTAAARIYEDNSLYKELVKLFYHSRNGQNLLELGYEEDIKFASKLDYYNLIPVYDGKIIRKKSTKASLYDLKSKEENYRGISF
ncbi:2-phosphosulfolactate phosphatase [Natronospora cellulosivora (SeqCode)]